MFRLIPWLPAYNFCAPVLATATSLRTQPKQPPEIPVIDGVLKLNMLNLNHWQRLHDITNCAHDENPSKVLNFQSLELLNINGRDLHSFGKFMGADANITELKIFIKFGALFHITLGSFLLSLKSNTTLKRIHISTDLPFKLDIHESLYNIRELIACKTSKLNFIDLSLFQIDTAFESQKKTFKQVVGAYLKRGENAPQLFITANNQPFVFDETILSDLGAFNEKINQAFEPGKSKNMNRLK